MKSVDARAHDLLRLMVELSQISDQDRTLTRFMEALRGICPDVHGHFSKDTCAEVSEGIPVECGDSLFGCLVIDHFYDLREEEQALIRNAVTLLAVILKKHEQERLLKAQTHSLPSTGNIQDLSSFFEDVMENVQDGIWVTDTHDVIVYVNRGMETIAGIPKEQILGKNVIQDFPKATTEQFNVFYQKAKRELKPTWYEVTVRTPAGVDTWQNGWLVPILKNGRFHGVICTIRDVTERKEAEKELEHSEARYRQLVETASDAIYMMDERGIIIDTNRIASQMLQRSREEIIGSLIDTVDPNFPVDAFLAFWKLVPYEEQHIFETTHITKHGNLIPIEISGKKFHIDEETYYFGVARDISARKTSEEELKRQRDFFELVINSAPTRIFWKDLNCVYLGCNTAFVEDAGMESPEDVIGKTDDVLVWKEDAETYRADDRRVMRTGKAKLRYEEEFINRAGNRVVWRTSKIPLKNPAGDIIGVLATSENITDEKLAAERLQASEEKYRFLAEKTSDTIILFDGAGRVEYISPNVRELSGYMPEEYMVFEPFENIYPDDRHIVENNLRKIAEGAEKTLVECRIFHKSGRLIWVQTRSKVIRNRNGNIESIISTSNDVTRRKENEEQLAQLYTELKTIYDNDPTYIYLKDTKNNILKVSNAVAEITGLPREEIEGKHSSEVYPDMAEDYYEDDREVMRTGEAKRDILETIPSITGGMRWVMTSKIPIREHGEAVSGILVVAADVTALKESEEKYRLIVENLNDLLVKFDAQGMLEYVSPNYCDTFGVHEGDILGTSFMPLIHPDDVGRVTRSLATLKDPPHRTYHEERAKTVRGWRWFAWSVRAITDEQRKILEFVAVGRDISQQKAFEAELIKAKEQVEANEAKFRSYVEYAPDGIFITDERGKYLQVNPAACEITGYSSQELLTMSIPDLLLKEDIKKGMAHFQETREKGSARGEMGFVTKGGETRFWHVAAVKLSDTRFLGFVKDTTERKHAEEKVQASEEKYRLLVENLSEGIWYIDAHANTTYVNQRMADMLGYRVDDMLGKHLFAFMDERGKAIARHKLQQRQQGIREQHDFEFIRKDGARVHTLIETTPVMDKQNHYIGALAGVLDITQRKQTEEALRVSEKKFRSFYENSPFGIVLCQIIRDEHGKAIDFVHLEGNPAAAEHTSLHVEDLVGKHASEIADSKVLADLTERYDHVVTTRKTLSYIEYFAVYDKTLQVTVFALEDDQFIINFIDITERKQAEEALKKSELKFRALFEQAGGYCMILDPNTESGIPVIVDANQAALKNHGYTREEFIGRPVADIDDEDGKKMVIARTRMIMTGKPFYVENTHLRKDGSTFPVAVNAKRIDIEGEPPLIFTIEYDISKRKEAERKLQEREEQYRMLAENARHLILTHNFDGEITYANTYALQFLHVPKEQIIGLDIQQFLSGKEEEGRLQQRIQEFQAGKTTAYQFELEIALPTGEQRIVEVFGNPITQNNTAHSVLLIAYDITERKKAEIQLQENEEKLRLTIDNSPLGVCTVDMQGNFLSTNQAYEKMLGYSKEEFKPLSFFEITHPDDRPENRDLFNAMFSEKTASFTMEKRYIRKDGGVISVRVHAGSIHDAQGKPSFGLAFIEDITARKQAEAALRESEHKFRILYENSPDMYVSVSPDDARILLCNGTLLRNTGYSKDEVIGSPVFTLYYEDCLDEAHRTFQQFVGTGKIQNKQLTIKRKDGSQIDVILNVDSVRDENGKILYSMSSWRDNTELKQAQDRILQSLREKETLLRELYHRTKNNMNVIQSMLTLQAAFSQNAEVERIAKEVGDKIQAMALVHQKLYQSQNLSRIPLHEYLSELAHLLQQTYTISPAKITLNLDVAPIFALIDTAIPCGLLLNELVSNAFKHAFPDERDGDIHIQLTEDEQGLITLQVSDNGAGVPQGFDFYTQESLGLQSIVMIAEHQLGGTVRFTAKNGVTCRIQFTDSCYQPRV